MSPPQVNFSEKKDSDSTSTQSKEEVKDVPSEKGDDFDCLDFSNIVLSEAERRAYEHRHGHHHHHHNHRGRNRCICGMVFVIILAVAAVVMIPLALKWRHKRHHHQEKFSCGHGSKEYKVDIDHDLQVIHAHKVPDGNMHIIHAYKRRVIAYKKGEHGVCFIDRLDESFDEGLMRWKSYKNMVLWDIKRFQVLSPKPIDIKVLEHFTDRHIFELCRDGKSVWVKEMDIEEVTTGKTVITF